MITQCPKCRNQFKPTKFRTSPDGSTLVECLICNFAFPFSNTEPVESGSKNNHPASSPAGVNSTSRDAIPKVEFVDPEHDSNDLPGKSTGKNIHEEEITQVLKPANVKELGDIPKDKDIPEFINPIKPRRKAKGYKHTIMIVDDTAFFRKVLSDLFEENGYIVLTAVDGVDGISKIKKEKDIIDLLLLDLQLPKMSGFEVLDNLHRSGLTKNFPILIITGIHQKTEEVRLVKQLGASGYISKANTPEYFLFRVNQILNPSQAVWVEPQDQ